MLKYDYNFSYECFKEKTPTVISMLENPVFPAATLPERCEMLLLPPRGRRGHEVVECQLLKLVGCRLYKVDRCRLDMIVGAVGYAGAVNGR